MKSLKTVLIDDIIHIVEDYYHPDYKEMFAECLRTLTWGTWRDAVIDEYKAIGFNDDEIAYELGMAQFPSYKDILHHNIKKNEFDFVWISGQDYYFKNYTMMV
tara:strand:+ start:262 stop:570 length:309 start_codon:yes stop_codon:yes gene_type:complete